MYSYLGHCFFIQEPVQFFKADLNLIPVNSHICMVPYSLNFSLMVLQPERSGDVYNSQKKMMT